MRINGIKKYFFGNVLAFFGYAVFLFYVHYFLIVRPKELAFEQEMIEKYGEVFLNGLHEVFYTFVYISLIVLLLVLLLVEFLIRKNFKPELFKNISIPENIFKIYNILFCIGLFFIILPLLTVIPFLLFICMNYFRIF